MKTIELHYDFGSPNAYLVHKVIPAVTQSTGVQFEYVPILLGGVFKLTNNVSPAVSLNGVKNKPAYQVIETQRFCNAHGIATYTPNPNFPVNTLKMMRGAVYARDKDFYMKYIDTMYSGMWEQALKLDEDDVIEATILAAGLPAEEIMAAMDDPAVKRRLVENTENTVAHGTFGSPTLFVGDEIYFGKDKLRDAIEASLAQ